MFDALTSSAARLQQRRRLPFLLRNLRMGFESRCRTFHVPIGPEDFPKAPVRVQYRKVREESDNDSSDYMTLDDDGIKFQEFAGSLAEWACPLCELHKPFRNRSMLAYHLERDHGEVQVSWFRKKIRNVSSSCV